MMLCALVAHASALALRAPARAPLALGRRTALRMALPSAVEEFVPENVASDAAQMKQVDELWKVCAWHARVMRLACTWHARGMHLASSPVVSALIPLPGDLTTLPV